MGKGVTIVIQGDGESARRALEMVRENLKETGDEAKREASEIVDAMEQVKSALETVGVFIGIRESIDLMKEMVGSSVDLGMEIGHLAKETGISAENLSTLKYASDVTGVSFEALTKGSLKLSKTMLDAEEGKKQAINSFSRLGISQDEVKGKANDLYGMLGLIADRFEKIPDGPQKAATAIGLFGKAGAALVPFLDQGATGIAELRGEAEQLGLVLDESGVQRMEALHQESARLKGGLEGLEIQITEGLSPALLDAASSFQQADGEAKNFQSIGETLGVGVKILATLWDLLTVAVHQTVDVLYEAGAQASDSVALIGNAIKLLAQVKDNPLGAADYLAEAKAKMGANLEAMKNDFKASMTVMGNDGKIFRDQMAALWDGTAAKPKPHVEAGTGGGIVTGDQSGNKDKSTDGIERAATALSEAQANAAAAAIKAANSRMISELDAAHKAQLISDADFYQEKLLLEKDSLDAEATAIVTKEAELQSLLVKQKTEKLKRKDGISAEELKTQQELVALGEKLNDLAEKRAALDTSYQIGQQTRADDVRLATAKMLAAVEEQTNQTITARLALLRMESEQELEKIGNTAGKSSPEYAQAQALEQLKEAKLQIGDVNRQITDTENDYKRAVEELNDAAAKDPRLKRAAQQQINALNAQEAAQLRDLVAQYDALASVLGGTYLEAAKNLHAEMDKLSRPDQRDEAQFTKSIVTGLESMTKQMADAATSGRESFHSMAKSIEKDLLDLAIKLAEEKWITPALSGGGGKLPSTSVGGGAGSAASLLGAAAPSLLGATSPSTGGQGLFAKLFEGVGGGGAKQGMPNVTINLTNASSTPMSARQTGTSVGSDAKDFIIHTVLEDVNSSGPLASLFSGMG